MRPSLGANASTHALGLTLGLLLFALNLPVLPAQEAAGKEKKAEQPPASESYYMQAWRYENADGRLDEALAMYQGLAARDDVARSVRAKALFRAGLCLRKLQRRDESLATLERVVDEFADCADVAAEAKRALEGETKAEAALRAKVEDELLRLTEYNRKAKLDRAKYEEKVSIGNPRTTWRWFRS